MKLDTVKIRNKKTGATRKINLHEWAQDLGLGKWPGWESVGGEQRGVPGAEEEARISSPDQFEEPILNAGQGTVAEADKGSEEGSPIDPSDKILSPDIVAEKVSEGSDSDSVMDIAEDKPRRGRPPKNKE